MITLRRDTERRHVQGRENDIWHTFCPENHEDPLSDGIGALVVFNEIRLPPGGSTARQRHDDAEIITYVHKGGLAQEDSTGRSGVIHAGEFQRMSIGGGIRLKETNASQTDWTHIFRTSLLPSAAGLDCAHEQKHFTAAQRHNVLCVVASPDGRKGSLCIHQEALIYSSILDPGRHLVHELLPERSAWLHVVYGVAKLDGAVLFQGDGVGVTLESSVSLTGQENTEILLVDLAGQTSRPFGRGVVP
ncbi:pirin family protein [Planctomycetota bacterium]